MQKNIEKPYIFCFYIFVYVLNNFYIFCIKTTSETEIYKLSKEILGDKIDFLNSDIKKNRGHISKYDFYQELEKKQYLDYKFVAYFEQICFIFIIILLQRIISNFIHTSY